MSEEKTIEKVVVFGSGSFGTALAYCVSRNVKNVVILARNEKVVESINTQHFNVTHFAEYILPNNITCTTNAEEAIKGANYAVHAIPIQSSAEYLENLKDLIPNTLPIISSSKGIHTETLCYMSDLIPSVLSSQQPMAFISGPSFAKELMSNQPSAVVVASSSNQLAVEVQKVFASRELRVYTTDDVIGVEVGGALKNIFAIAAGCAEGLGLGLNTLAAVVTRGCGEMMKLATAMGARPTTVSGLSGVGDLMLTCFGSLSRNRTVGKRLGQGETLQEILDSMSEVAEGVPTAIAAQKLAEKYQLDLPIIHAVSCVVQGTISPKDAVESLLSRPMSDEFAGLVC